jgi:hypothetical protein
MPGTYSPTPSGPRWPTTSSSKSVAAEQGLPFPQTLLLSSHALVRTVCLMNRGALVSVAIGVVVGAVLGMLLLKGIGPIVGIIMGGCLGYAFHLTIHKNER